MVLSSFVVATVAGQAMAADPVVLSQTQANAAQLPMFDRASLVQGRGGIGTGLLSDANTLIGAIAWRFDSNGNFGTAAFIEGLPDDAPINGGPVNGGPALAGSITQEATHNYLGFDANNGFHVHEIGGYIESTGGDLLPGGFTFSDTTTANFLSMELGTGNLEGGTPFEGGFTFDGEALGYFSATMDVFAGGALIDTSDFFDPANLSFAGTYQKDAINYNDSFTMQGFTNDFLLVDISGFGINRFEISATVAVAVPTPGTAALFGLAGLAGVRRRRYSGQTTHKQEPRFLTL